MDNNDIIASLDPSGKLGEFIKTHKWPLVAEYCEKQGKRSEASELWKIIRAIALATDSKANKKDLGLHELQILLKSDTPVTDPAALLVLESFNQSTSQDDSITPLLLRIWERAAQKLSGNTSWLFKTWFQAKFLKGRYSDAKQATMAWMKAYPKDHDPFYLFIIINELLARLPDTSPADIRLSGMLASKALATAASTTDASGKAKSDIAGRTLASHDDLTILVEVYQRQAKYEEALQVLQSPKTGLTSQIGRSSWPLTLQMIDLKGLCGDYESQWVLSYDILRASHPEATGAASLSKESTFGALGDDWRIWNSLVTAALKLSTTKPEFLARTEHIFTEFEKLNSRNASIAQLKIHSKLNDDSNSAMLMRSCQLYFGKFARKVACMRDIRPHLTGLLRVHQEMLVENLFAKREQKSLGAMETKVAIVDHLVEQLNCLKLDYSLIATRTRREERPRLLSRLVQACLRLHQVSIKLDLKLPHSDQGPVDDAMILASSALIHLYHLGNRAAILRSVIVLEHLLQYSKHNYEAMLILIKLYMYLGLGSLAIDRYAHLSIKNIQHASISWILFPRISKIHPHPVKTSLGEPASSVFDPIEETRSALDWYKMSGTMTNKAIERAIRGNQHLTIISLLETQELLQDEVSRLVLYYEEFHLSRSHREPPRFKKAAKKIPKRMLDSRDRSAFPNHEAASQIAFEEMIPNVIPNFSQFFSHSSWLLYEWENDQILDQLRPSTLPVHGQELQNLDSNLLPEDLRKGLTPIEAESLSLLRALERILSSVTVSPTPSATIGAEVDSYQQRLVVMKENLGKMRSATGSFLGHLKLNEAQSIPVWFAFHGPFTMLTTVRSIKEATQNILSDKQVEADQRRELQNKIVDIAKRCDDLKDAINAEALAQRNAVKSASFKDFLRHVVCDDEGDTAGQAILNVIGTDAVDATCNMLSESWIDAFEGVIKSSSGS